MAVDIQVVAPQEVIQLTQVRYTPAGPLGLPTALDIIGADFRSVDEVLINDIPSPDVLVLSQNRLIAQLPDSLQASPNVTSVLVTSRQLTLTSKSFIRFKVSDQPSRVSGILRLVQVFLKVLFTTPGTDIWNRRSGGGGLRRVGTTFGSDDGGNITTDFIISVDTATRQIIASQGRNPSLPPDERLLSAKVTRASFNRELAAILASVEITSQAGRAATANLEL